MPVGDLHIENTRAVVVQARDVYLNRLSTAQAFVKAVRYFYRWVVVEDSYGVTVNPAVNIDNVYARTEGHRIWTAKEVRQYLNYHKPGTLAYLTMVLVLSTAARRGDLVGLGNANIKDGWIRWRQEKPPHIVVDIPVMDMLSAELEWHKPFGETFLGISDDKTKRSKNSFGNKFTEWRVEADLPKGLSLHGIRKGLASILTEFGLSILPRLN